MTLARAVVMKCWEWKLLQRAAEDLRDGGVGGGEEVRREDETTPLRRRLIAEA